MVWFCGNEWLETVLAADMVFLVAGAHTADLKHMPAAKFMSAVICTDLLSGDSREGFEPMVTALPFHLCGRTTNLCTYITQSHHSVKRKDFRSTGFSIQALGNKLLTTKRGHARALCAACRARALLSYFFNPTLQWFGHFLEQ